MTPSCVLIKAEAVVTMGALRGRMGTETLTERYSGAIPSGHRAVASVAIHDVAGGISVVLFPMHSSLKAQDFSWSWRNATADGRSTFR
jgi:hypothetical protein